MRVSNDVLAVLSRAQVIGAKLVINDPLERSLYVKTDKVLQAAGGRWLRKEKAHVFDQDAATRIDQILLTGEVDVPKDDFNYFPTPPQVVARLLQLAQIQPGQRLLEPQGGQGAIAIPCAEAGAVVDCFELMDANYQVLVGDRRLASVIHGDFLNQTPVPVYDRVVMNPPFARQADIHHVRHALRFLKPTGKLVSVMSAGVCYRDNQLTRDFREQAAQLGGRFEELPAGSFKASGTLVNTVILECPAAHLNA